MKSKKSEGLRHNAGKNPLELVPETAIFALGKCLEAGAKKYERENWRRGLKVSSLIGCLERHMGKFKSPHISDIDPEDQLHHIMKVMINAAFILEMLIDRPDLDDRYKSGEFRELSKEEWLKLLGMVE